MSVLKPGKLPPELLQRMLISYTCADSRVIVGPAVGEDAAIIDMGDQMTQLMIAQRGYEANLSVIDRAKDAYQQALSIGRSS